jgi:Predicted acetyltransferase
MHKHFTYIFPFPVMTQSAEDSSEKETIKLSVEGKEVGYISFIVTGGKLEIRHTVVYPEFRGKGYGRTLVDSVISIAESRNLTVISSCSYADRLIDKVE